MATIWGNAAANWQAYGVFTATDSATATTVSLTQAGMASMAYGFQLTSRVSCTASLTGQASASGSGGFSSGYGETVTASYVAKTWTVRRGKTAQALTLTVTTTVAAGFHDGTSTASTTVSVPALASYRVGFDANGGASAPAAQTKWYGEALALSTQRPSRNGYTFKGWATTSGGAVAYAPGASYTANAAATLYAVWAADYALPSVSGLSAYRCDKDGSASASGAYLRVRFSWKVNQAGAKGSVAKVEYRQSGAASWTAGASVADTATSGSVDKVVGGSLSASAVLEVRATVTDSNSRSGAASVTVGARFHVISVANSGKAVAFGKQAVGGRVGVEVAGSLYRDGEAYFSGVGGWKREPKAYFGTEVVTCNGSAELLVWTAAQFTAKFGKYTQGTTHVSLSNGDWNAHQVGVMACIQGGGVVAKFTAAVSNSFRIDYAVFN